tara:strand:+ start:77964 stop:78278 length:315 start_codon:yes stop_codon:yes gene_type:complete
MISLTEKLKLPITDWKGELQRLKAGECSVQETNVLIGRASCYNTCVVGCLSVDIPRKSVNKIHFPIDKELISLGASFYGRMWSNKFDEAEEFYEKIQERAKETR